MSNTAVSGALPPAVHPAAGVEVEATATSQSSMQLGAASSNAMAGSSTSATAQSSLPMRKRKQEALEAEEANAAVSAALSQGQVSTGGVDEGNGHGQPLKRAPMTKAREVRLEQNRKAARESRRRKKIMIEELQRSVVFFSRANGTLKHQNEELQRLLLNAQSRISSLEKNASGAANANAGMNVNVNANANANANNGNNALTTAQAQAQANAQVSNQDHSSNGANSVVQVPPMQAMTMNLTPQQSDTLPNNQLIKEDPTKNNDVRDVQAQQAVASAQAQAQAQAHAVQAQAQAAQAAATQAMFQNQGFPPAAARAAAQTFVAGPPPAANGATGHDVQVQQALANNLSSIMMGMPVNQMQGQVQVQNQVQQVQNQVQNQAGNDNNANLGVSMSAPVAAASTQQIQNAFLAMQQLTQMQHAQQPGSNQNQAQVQAPAPVGNMFQNAFAPMGVQVPVSLPPATAPTPAPAPIANNMNVPSPSAGPNDSTI